ncbi:MAG: immune inhibitor A [Flavobacteriales bacterium]|nr:immune inhibitor A [Flavobacteriales bacterium]
MKSKITLLIISFIFAFGTSNAQTTVLSEDFEGGTLGNFTGGIPTGTLNWNLTQIRGGDPGHSSISSAYFGNPIDTSYDTGAIEGGELTSGAIDLSAYASATLSFNYFLETEAFAPYDIAQALVSTDGVTFVAVATNQAGNLVDPSGTWQPVTIDISAYAGFATVYIRFDFNTVDDVANAFEGFYVDDVTVVASTFACNLIANASSTDETTAGANDGTGTAIATGGTPPYTYLWSDPASQTTATAIGLAPGTYTVTITDANSCIATATITIQPAGVGCTLVVTATSTDETTAGANDGTGTATATGGTDSVLLYVG